MSDYYAQTLEARRKMKLRIVIYFTSYFIQLFAPNCIPKESVLYFCENTFYTTLTHDTKWT